MTEDLKQQAALAALDEVQDGSVVGLGTGSTAMHFIRGLGDRVRAGLRVLAIPTSEASSQLAQRCGIPLTTFRDHASIDVTVDGADEVSPQLDLIKGLGGALVREKVVAHASRRVVIVVDESKVVERLGNRAPLPVEVVPFAIHAVERRLLEIGGACSVRNKDGQNFISDNGNLIIDWKCGEIADPATLEQRVKAITGVVDSGLFCAVAQLVLVGTRNGVREMRRS